MRKIKTALLIVLLGIGCYFLSLYVFTLLKGQGYTPLIQDSSSCDLVIKHAYILDGTGETKRFRGDIAVRNGRIVAVGRLSFHDVPEFDAGGLTVMPIPVDIEKTDEILEHLFKSSYPRYPAHQVYFTEGPYKGLNLAQVAKKKEEKTENVFKYLRNKLLSTVKVYLVPLELDENKLCTGSYTLEQLAAYVTGYPAQAMGKKDRGMVKIGYKADLCFFITHDYDDNILKEYFLKGELPSQVFFYRDGKPVSQ